MGAVARRTYLGQDQRRQKPPGPLLRALIAKQLDDMSNNMSVMVDTSRSHFTLFHLMILTLIQEESLKHRNAQLIFNYTSKIPSAG